MHIFTAPTIITKAREDWKSFLSTLEPGQIIVNNSPNRFGKTYSTLDYTSRVPGRWLYLSDRHAQIGELEHIEKVVHWKGFKKSCERKDDPFIAALISNGIGARVICKSFCSRKSCKYRKQFKIPDDVIVIAPKEYLATSYVDGHWDMIIWDENLERARKVQLVYPTIPDDAFIDHAISSRFYKAVGRVRDGHSEYDIKDLEIWANTALSKFSGLISEIKEGSTFSPTAEENNLISFINNIPMTLEWIQCAQEYGLMDHYYKPYLHNAFDLQRKHQSPLVILNTSYNSWIYDQIANNYYDSLPKPILKGIMLNNPDSYLLHYYNLKRSCSRNAILNSERSKFGGSYGDEIYEMVKRTINFANKRELKVGVITFQSLIDEIEKLFGDKVDVTGHYGGHQGSKTFDDVDVLINIGTYHLNPLALYNKHYIINKEYLAHSPAKWGGENTKIINGMLVTLTDNEKLNRIKLYKLNEEHGQAIFRSGAHVSPRKLVVNFGYVPEGLEKTLTYKRFHNKNSLIAILNRIKSKIG